MCSLRGSRPETRKMDTTIESKPINFAEEKINQLVVLKEEYESCTKCSKLCETRSKVVFGTGNPEAKIMVIAEGPGKTEDELGIPLIGESGKLLDYFLSYEFAKRDERFKKVIKTFKILKNSFGKTMYTWPHQEEAKKLLCEYIFYTNVILCWPGKGNRDPEHEEVENCKERLLKTIYLVDPTLIISVGSWAAKTLAGTRSFTITKERGKILDVSIPGILTDIHYPVFPILHPAYLLRLGPSEEENSEWVQTRKDIQRAITVLEEVTRIQ